MLKAWKNEDGKRLAIFSSGSVRAQNMFFGHVELNGEGEAKTEDLNPLFSANFDTLNAGPKMEKQSYDKIAKELGMSEKPRGILFLSDNVKETRAAKEAGFQVLVVDRPGNAPLSEDDSKEFQVVESLEEIKLN